MPSNVMGLDLSLEGTGLCVLDGDGKLVDSMTLGTKPRDGNLIVRSGMVWRMIFSEVCLHSPRSIIIEDVFFYRRAPKWDPRQGRKVTPRPAGDRAARSLWSLSAIVRYQLEVTLRLPVAMVNTMNLKKFVTGNGKASKEMIMRAIKIQWQVDFKGRHNEADAYVLARMGVEGAV